jgi:hypothetical protein
MPHRYFALPPARRAVASSTDAILNSILESLPVMIAEFQCNFSPALENYQSDDARLLLSTAFIESAVDYDVDYGLFSRLSTAQSAGF